MIDATETLCILCQKSCTGGCSWSERLEPVKGWTAEENTRRCLVIDCPEYVKETPESILPADIDRDGMMRLLEAVAKQMREDYIHGKGPYDQINQQRHKKVHTMAEIRSANRKAIEKWLMHGQGAQMLGLSNPEEVVGMLRKMARRYDTELAMYMR